MSGCNVFRHPKDGEYSGDDDYFKCNACDLIYYGEK